MTPHLARRPRAPPELSAMRSALLGVMSERSCSVQKVKAEEFRKKLDVFFVKRGCFRLNAKAIDEFGNGAENHMDALATPVPELARQKCIANAKRRILGMMDDARAEDKQAEDTKAKDGKPEDRNAGGRTAEDRRAEWLLDNGYIRSWPDWGVEKNRKDAFAEFLAFTGFNKSLLTTDLIIFFGFRGMMKRCEPSSVYGVLVDTGVAYSLAETKEHAAKNEFPGEKLYFWQMKCSPQVNADDELASAAVKWMAKQLEPEGVVPKKIRMEHFIRFGLDGVLLNHDESPYLALAKAGFAYTLEETFKHAHMGNGYAPAALPLDAKEMSFGTEKFYFWEMDATPHLYGRQDCRNAAARWIAWEAANVGIAARDVTYDFVEGKRMNGLYLRHEEGLFGVFLEAGLVTEADREYMKRKGPNRFSPLV